MKIIYLILSFLFILPVFGGNAVLLTSVKISMPVQVYLSLSFKKTFSNSGLKVVVQHKVTPELLQRTITDPETEILIWISHSGAEIHGENGLGTKGVILDYYGNDVKNFFTSPNKNLKFLGIVGCSAKSIIEGFTARGNYLNRPDLEIKSYDEKIKLYRGFHETLKESLDHVGKDFPRSIDYENEVSINISFNRKENKYITSSWLEIGDKVLTVLSNESENKLNLSIAQSDWNQMKSKNIRFNRSKGLREDETYLPEIEFKSDLGTWKLFTTKDGNVIGANNKNLYIYSREPRS